jgi:hypothetical protein
MKQIIILIIPAVLLIVSSCKRAYSCECTTIDSLGGTATTKRDISKTSKKTAQAICGNYTSEYTYTDGSSTTTQLSTADCELQSK